MIPSTPVFLISPNLIALGVDAKMKRLMMSTPPWITVSLQPPISRLIRRGKLAIQARALVVSSREAWANQAADSRSQLLPVGTVSPSTPAAAFIFSSRNASSSSSTLMWCRSAVNFSCFLVLAIRRMRSSACDTLSRPWVRHVLCCSAFSLVSALGSADSAAAASAADCSTASLSALFTGFSATMTESDFLRSCVIGYGSSPSRCGPPALSGRRSNAGSPRFRRDPFARDVLFDPGRVDSTSHNGTAHVAFGSKGQPPPPAKRVFRGSITHPTQPLCTLRVRHCCRLTQHSLPGGLLGLTWAGLAPADRASLAGAFPLPTLRPHILPRVIRFSLVPFAHQLVELGIRAVREHDTHCREKITLSLFGRKDPALESERTPRICAAANRKLHLPIQGWLPPLTPEDRLIKRNGKIEPQIGSGALE